MHPTQVITRAGKRITIISATDLRDPLLCGNRLRAFCHLHGGDHQRSLSIDPQTGWGYCFNVACQALVLVAEYSPQIAERLKQRAISQVQRQPGRFREPIRQPSPSSQPSETVTPRSAGASGGARWQQEERAALLRLDGLWREALVNYALCDCWQAQAYLQVRGIPLELAEEAGVGYLPATLLDHPDVAPVRRLLQRWAERLLFPLTSPLGRGYIGRSLWRWQLGMDEVVHKALLSGQDAPRRWIKTYPAGWFCVPPVQLASQIVLVEGPFDRLALLAGGFRPHEVVALVGTAASSDWLPEHIRSLLLALDGDAGGNVASTRLMERLQQERRRVECCAPPADGLGKDWSERWRKAGQGGLDPLYPRFALLEHDL